ncbi:T6SS immunity protein Tdi1 domain-containing protein [Microcella humidisoli]|uniref:DUF1851 domain-containing protein n=1 Tax=Microcella humidisoli TaxID=2963406 RepID=A0ABY5FZV9_9MICO|nr:T6SS immunity protein Tdi1 domain-containing protein [Microcella humidisoli]UTT63839.1 DUF1851 domain-containing protein [Microcella humidisoli]
MRRFTGEQYARALESWAFLDLAGKKPSLSSPFGDIFFESEDGWWFLDIVGGNLTRDWSSGAELQAALNTRDGQDNYLMVELATAATGLNLHPGEDEILSFTVPPMLGGPLSADNVEVSDMVVSVNLYGQIHEQTRNLPPGTPIAGINIT